MRKPLIVALAAVLALGACAAARESRLNPANWFGRSAPEAPTLAPAGGYAPRVVDNRPPVEQVTFAALERIPGGAILRATGLPPTQGWWDAELVAETEGVPAGTLAFRFVVAGPRTPQPVSTPQSREVTVATYLSDIALREVRQIVVRGRLNERVLRR